MALNSTGAISLGGSTTGQSVAVELGQSATAAISLNDSAVRTLAGVASGAISMSSLRGKSNAGSQVYTTAGVYSWVAPAGVTSVSVVAVGAGAGGGGGLGYKNNITVIPGNSYSVSVALGNTSAACRTNSVFCNTGLVAGNSSGGNTGGTYVGDGGGNGGARGTSSCGYPLGKLGSYGGAGGYSGAGGRGAQVSQSNPYWSFCIYQVGSDGTGGGGGGGGGMWVQYTCPYPDCQFWYNYAGGGGVGLYGQGANGAGGIAFGTCSTPYYRQTAGGGGGSGGTMGGNLGVPSSPACLHSPGTVFSGTAGDYGGGGLGPLSGNRTQGAVRIVWPGTTRQFPSTNVGLP